MALPPQWAIDEFSAATTQHTRHVDIYESDGETPWMLNADLNDGTATVDYSRDDRRNIDLTFVNHGELDHNPNGGLWYDKILKAYRGVERGSDGATWETQIGEFMIERISIPRFPDLVKVTGRDYKKKMEQSKFVNATSFASGQTVESVISAIAGAAGITKRNIPITGSTLGRDFIWERGVSRWDACLEVATAYGYELFFDANGYLVLRLYRDPYTSPSEFTFQTGDTSNLADYEKVLNDSRLYNHVVVEGAATDTIPVWAEATNTIATSPTRISRIGDRLYQYVSSFITTTAQAQQVADNFLTIHALEEFEGNLESLMFPWMEAGDIVDFIDPRPYPGEPTRFLLSSFNIPMKLGTMSSTVKRVSDVG